MTDDIHRRALAAAVRLSLSCTWGAAALVTACEPSPRTTPIAAHPRPTPQTEQPEAARVPDDATVAANEYEQPKPHRVDPLPATMTCDERLDAVLTPAGNADPGTREAARRTQAVLQCCTDLVRTEPFGTEHFWDCCNIVRTTEGAVLPQSCSPWGPAVPPSIGWTPGRGIA